MRRFGKISSLFGFLVVLSLAGAVAPAADEPAPAEGGNTLLGPSGKLDGLGFSAYSSVNGTICRDYWDSSTKKKQSVPGSQGFRAHTKDSSIADILITNEKTGDYVLHLKRPGVTSVFFTDANSGKVPRYGAVGELITVVDPAELPTLQGQPVDIVAEQDFLLPIPGEIFRLRGLFRRELAGRFTLNFTVTAPDGRLARFSKSVPQSRFAAGAGAVVYEEPLGEGAQTGQYNVEVVLSEASGRMIAVSRFDIWIGEYGFAGRIGSPRIDDAVVWVSDGDLTPDGFAVYGRFPKRFQGSARLYLDDRLVSDRLELYRQDLIVFDLRGTQERFPATRRRMALFLEDVGYSLAFDYDNPVDPRQVEPLKLPARSTKGAWNENAPDLLLDSDPSRSSLRNRDR
ncbi:MAG: hypothetical protein HYX74_11160 [Acidobacteria bacterium]|nr:hypothetical protein [Acidobacteriota bacterium]